MIEQIEKEIRQRAVQLRGNRIARGERCSGAARRYFELSPSLSLLAPSRSPPPKFYMSYWIRIYCRHLFIYLSAEVSEREKNAARVGDTDADVEAKRESANR